ncbi:MAG TPA: c-type cytochrome [Gaiellaceae bacterium]|jgi:mono/diheme cytochrome c family protein|nr:c-type cytochrome [Gaiellaceae bacterium]
MTRLAPRSPYWLLLGVPTLAAIAVFATTSAAAPLRHSGTTIVVTLGTPKELSVKLSRSSRLAAGPVVFQITNRGKAQHTFVLCSKPVAGLVNACSGKSVTVSKTGQTKKLAVSLKKGKYEFLSIVSGQSVAGSKGAIGVGLSVPIAISSIPKTTSSGGKPTGSGSGSGSASGSGAGTGSGSAGNVPVFPTGNAKNGPTVFGIAGCGSCHTLAAAGASGGGGPDLDDLMPSLGDVENQVYNGGGGMPPFGGQLTNQQIADVAAYVSSVAGHPASQ